MKRICFLLLVLISFVSFAQKDSLQFPCDTVYIAVEEMPVFKGGEAELYKFLFTSIKNDGVILSDSSKIPSKVYVSFVISTNGKVVNEMIVKSSGVAAIDQSVLKAVKAMPVWTPGKMSGRLVCVKFTLPVQICLK